jgi:Ca2+:H+ antiporter
MIEPMPARVLSRSDLVVIAASGLAVVLAGVTRHVGAVLPFVVAALAIALLASLVGRSVDQLGERLGAGATGVVQSALGNLPELFIGYFALQAGLIQVVQAAIIGSILANILFVLGLAFVVGGLRHGTQTFSSARARMNMVLLVLATGALVLPSVAAYVHAPAQQHERTLAVIVSVVLLALFALSLPASLSRGREEQSTAEPESAGHRWPLWLAIGMLALSGVLAALVSDWFVEALRPAIDAMGMSQAFAGLIVVAIAGNAVENFVGIQLAARNQADYAISVIVNSPLQIALVLAPALVLLSFLTATTLTLVFAPLLVIAVVLSVLAVTLIVYDGESDWLEGATLVALYVIIGAVFWWG